MNVRVVARLLLRITRGLADGTEPAYEVIGRVPAVGEFGRCLEFSDSRMLHA